MREVGNVQEQPAGLKDVLVYQRRFPLSVTHTYS